MPIKDVFLQSVIRVWSISHYSALIISSGYKWMIGKFLLYLHISFVPNLQAIKVVSGLLHQLRSTPPPSLGRSCLKG